MLVCTRLRHAAGTQWGSKKPMNTKRLEAVIGDGPLQVDFMHARVCKPKCEKNLTLPALPFFSSTSPSQNRYAHWMNKLHISDDARQDLVEIKQYIAEDLDSPNAAAQTVKGILKGISRLKEQSGIGAPLSSIVPVESEYRFLV